MKLTSGERALCEEALALPANHDDQGCPSHRLYASIRKLQDTEPDSKVVDELWRQSYDDGRSCPMYSIHWAAEKFLKEDK